MSDWNSLEIEWTYASGVANQSSPRFGYTIDENITSQGVYINEFNTSNVYGSEWLGGLSDGEHTVFVALLDPTNGSILATDSHLFSLTSSTEPEDPGTSNDDITIINPGSGAVIERNATLSPLIFLMHLKFPVQSLLVGLIKSMKIFTPHKPVRLK